MRIGLISDTHGLLRPQAVDALAGVDHIIHAGDIGREDVLQELRAVAPVTAVRGNVDIDNWAGALPETTDVCLGGAAIHVLHILERLKPTDEARARVVVYGHTHRPLIETLDGVLFVNPGSAGPRRFSLPVTVGFLSIGGDGAIDAHILPLPV
jgi:hypothetical protein